jgi:hypothetical protein
MGALFLLAKRYSGGALRFCTAFGIRHGKALSSRKISCTARHRLVTVHKAIHFVMGDMTGLGDVRVRAAAKLNLHQ